MVYPIIKTIIARERIFSQALSDVKNKAIIKIAVNEMTDISWQRKINSN